MSKSWITYTGIFLLPFAVLLLFVNYAQSSEDDWPVFRRDLYNSGISELTGDLTNAEDVWNFPLGGAVGLAQMADVDNDGMDETFAITAGKISAFQENGDKMWDSPIIGVNYIFSIEDMNNDGSVEIICGSAQPPVLFIISGIDGTIEWQHKFPPPAGSLHPGGIKIADINNSQDGVKEIFCWPYSGNMVGHLFGFEGGLSGGSELWQVSAAITETYIPQVMVADMNNDTIPEVVIATYGHIYGWQGTDGTNLIDFEFKTGGSYDRNYGLISLTNIDDDPYPEIAVLAHNLNEHLTMLDNLGPEENMIKIEMLWDKWYEYSYPDDVKRLRVSPNSLMDVDNDGQIELVCSIFNDQGDSDWHLMIFDAQSGNTEYDGNGLYLYDLADLDGDSLPEILLNATSDFYPNKSSLGIMKFVDSTYEIVAAKSDYFPVMYQVQKLALNQNSTTLEEVFFKSDFDYDGRPEIFSKESMQILVNKFSDNILSELWRTQSQYYQKLLAAGRGSEADKENLVTAAREGLLLRYGADGTAISENELGNWQAMPVATDLDGDGILEVLICDAFGYTNVLDISNFDDMGRPTLKWRVPGLGKSAKYGRNFSPYTDDLNGDGHKETLLISGNKLIVYDNQGNVLQSYAFNDSQNYPYEWVTGYFNADSIKDILIAYNDGGGHTDKMAVYQLSDNTTPLWEKDYGPYSGYVAIFDFTNDGIDDVILREHYDLITLNGKNGAEIKKEPGAYYHTPILIDTDGDGDLEIVNGGGYIEVSVNNLDVFGLNISQIWEQPTGYLECYGRIPGTADTDGDSLPELGVSSTNGTFTCYNAANGNIKWTYDLQTTASDIIAFDADEDRRKEFVFGGLDGNLYIMNGETDAVQRIESKINLNAQAGSPIVADLKKNDSKIELLVTTYDGVLHCLRANSTAVNNENNQLPIKFNLDNCYPNPFNPSTTIHYSIANPANVKLYIYNILGQEVRILVNSFHLPKENYSVIWDGKDNNGMELPSGLYVAVLKADGFRKSVKILKMK